MRDAGLSVVLHCGGGSFKAQMKKADASGARYAALIGDDEAQAGKVTLKALRDVRSADEKGAGQVRLTLAESLAMLAAARTST
jgi:histidyl-tRNA synthetase